MDAYILSQDRYSRRLEARSEYVQAHTNRITTSVKYNIRGVVTKLVLAVVAHIVMIWLR